MTMHYQNHAGYSSSEDYYNSGGHNSRQHERPKQSQSQSSSRPSSKGMTPEEYEAERRSSTPQRKSKVPTRRAPPPGKFAPQGHSFERNAAQQRHIQQGSPRNKHPSPMRQPPPPPPPPSASQHHARKYTSPQHQQNKYSYEQHGFHNVSQTSLKHFSPDQRSGQHHLSSPRQNYQEEERQGQTPQQRDFFELKQQIQNFEEGRQQAEIREDHYARKVAQERESEINKINHKVHQVNDIYRDLAGLIDGQQDLIEKVDINIEDANAHTRAGIDNYDEARLRLENPIMEDLYGDKLGKKKTKRSTNPGKNKGKNASKNKRKSADYDLDEDFDCKTAFDFETISEDLKEVVKDMKMFGSKVFTACTAPEDYQYNEYASRV